MQKFPNGLLRDHQPAVWPSPPNDMTYSHLQEIETCPRRWSLTHAEYPGLWNQHGYPPKLQLRALEGLIVHKAAESITKELTGTGCSSLLGSGAIAAMKALGGFSGLLDRCITKVLSAYADNPRANNTVDSAKRTLEAQVPHMRMHVQSLLGKLDLSFDPTSRSAANHMGERRRPLGFGIYPEVEVRAPKIAWKGKIDILLVKESGCEIVDLKTGEFRDSHQFQLRVYALLWSLDTDLNPKRLLANKLTLSYDTSSVKISGLSLSDLDRLEQDVISRTERARAAVKGADSDAIVVLDKCRYCSVRHLCEDYWRPSIHAKISENDAEFSIFCDCELRITDRHGPTSWDAVVRSSNRLPNNTPVLLRMPASASDFKLDDQIRILDTQLAIPTEDGQLHVLTPTTLTEFYLT
jgi:hypothetical protein